MQPIIKVTMPAAETSSPATQSLNFYKALPKGETTALGSGINTRATLPAAAPEPALRPAPEIPVVTTKTPEPIEIADKPTPPPAPISRKEEESGSWILQASSYPREQDAQTLGKQLRSKGYKTDVKPVVIKGKTWFRVYVGPYTTAAAAKEAATKLSRQERLRPIARKI